MNTTLFRTVRGLLTPRADAVNHEAAPAYRLTPRHQLAQLAATGCLNTTFYASAEVQLDAVLTLAAELEPERGSGPASPSAPCAVAPSAPFSFASVPSTSLFTLSPVRSTAVSAYF